MWSEARDYAGITFGLVLYAFGFTFFLMPYEIVTGGVAGVAAIVQYATQIPNQYTYFLVNAALLILALRILGLKFLMKTIYAIFMLTFLLWFMKELVPHDAAGNMVKILGEGQDFMSLVIGCMMTGSALGIVFVNNGSTGGSDIIAASVNKFYNMSLGTVLLLLDFVIIGSCLFIPQFGTMLERGNMVVFGFCTMVIENFMLDYLYNRRRSSVQFLIFSEKYQEIAYEIGTHMEHGVTILDGHGWYTGQERKVLCILARKNESSTIFRIIKAIDPNAFVSQSSVIGVYGEGFDEMKVKVKQEKKKMKIVFATNNQHKLSEIRNILGNRFEVLSLTDIGCQKDIPENGQTLNENALIKAKYVYDTYRINCFSDDTGLEVEALGGAPGVYSARYAGGEGHDSEANMQKLLHNLENKDNRKARFRTVIALIIDGKVKTFEGIVNGEIIREKRGGEGFGYDPIFQPEGYNQTFAELGVDIKNQISHRAKASQKLAEYLKTL